MRVLEPFESVFFFFFRVDVRVGQSRARRSEARGSLQDKNKWKNCFSLVFASLIAFSSSVGVPVGARAPSGSLAHPYLALENRMEEKPRRQ